MRVLVACEFSGQVREAFRARGHEAVSCDLLPSEREGPHVVGDALELLKSEDWQLLIAFPPCTHLSASGARWWKEKQKDGRQESAIRFFLSLANAEVPMIAIENPIGIMSSVYKRPTQIIQPWQFGHGETKATCLWLKGLPALKPTKVVPGREQRIWRMPPSEDRQKERSRTYPGIAKAMAEQWG